jgi:hypothetical protein
MQVVKENTSGTQDEREREREKERDLYIHAYIE